jgi:hypothetical protein
MLTLGPEFIPLQINWRQSPTDPNMLVGRLGEIVLWKINIAGDKVFLRSTTISSIPVEMQKLRKLTNVEMMQPLPFDTVDQAKMAVQIYVAGMRVKLPDHDDMRERSTEATAALVRIRDVLAGCPMTVPMPGSYDIMNGNVSVAATADRICTAVRVLCDAWERRPKVTKLEPSFPPIPWREQVWRWGLLATLAIDVAVNILH